jgi:hypothetical protein
VSVFDGADTKNTPTHFFERPLRTKPITGIACCCVRAAPGKAAAATPVSLMNCRRRIIAHAERMRSSPLVRLGVHRRRRPGKTSTPWYQPSAQSVFVLAGDGHRLRHHRDQARANQQGAPGQAGAGGLSDLARAMALREFRQWQPTLEMGVPTGGTDVGRLQMRLIIKQYQCKGL